MSPEPTRSPAASSASGISARGRFARRPTARPNASSAPCSKAGPTARSTDQATNAPAPLTAGSGTTTITANTSHRPATTHRPPEQPAWDLHLGRLAASRPAATFALAWLGHVPPRIRLDAERTAIRPLAVGDATEFAEAVVANRAHTEPWKPIHAEAHYTRAGQVETLRRDVEAWDVGTGYAFAVLDRARGDAIIGRIALGNVVRGAWRNATLGYWVSCGGGRSRPRDGGGPADLRLRVRARGPAIASSRR